MISLLFLILSLIILFFALKNKALGYSLLIATEILIPKCVRVGLGSANVSIHTFLIITLFLICFFKRKKEKFHSIYEKLFLFYIIFFICFNFFICLFGGEMGMLTQIKANIQFIITDILIAILGIYSIKNNEDLNLFSKYLTYSVLIGCTYGLFTYFIKMNPYVQFLSIYYGQEENVAASFINETRGIIQGRIMGTYMHPLAWGQLLATIFPFMFFIKKHISKITFWITITLLVINVFLSGSRSTLLPILLSSAIIWYYQPIGSKTKQIVTIFLITPIFLLIPLNKEQSTALKETQKTIEASIFFWNKDKSDEVGIKGSSINMRKNQLDESFKMISGFNTFFGLGAGYVRDELRRTGGHPVLLGYESIVFYKLVEQGIIGLIVFFIFYCQIYNNCKNAVKYRLIKKIRPRYISYINALYIPYLISIIFTGIQSGLFMTLIFSVIIIKQITYKNLNPIK